MIPDEIPIRQSERHQIYKDAAQKLIDSGFSYWCDCSKEMLDEMRKWMPSQVVKSLCMTEAE